MACCMCEKFEWDDPQEVIYTDLDDGKEYCLFHAPAKHKGMPVDEFNAQVSERIQAVTGFEDENALCDLSGTIFPGDVCVAPGHTLPTISFHYVRIEGGVDFRFAHINGDADFSFAQIGRGVDFRSAQIGGFVDFGSAQIGGDAYFSSAHIKGGAYFRSVQIEGDSDFSAAYIEGDAYFRLAQIAGNAHFSSAQFGRLADLHRATFGGNADFFTATFEGETDFRGIAFGGDADFGEATFGWRADFHAAAFGEGANFHAANFGQSVYFVKANFGWGACFNNATFDGDVYFNKATFGGGVDFSTTKFRAAASFWQIAPASGAILTFENCLIPLASLIFQDCDPTCLDLTKQHDLSNIHFMNSPWDKKGRVKACTEDLEDKLQYTRDFYQRMKAKYKAENNEYEASKWHIAEKEAQLKLLRQNGESKVLCVGLELYKLSSRFGEDPVLAGKWLLGVIALVWLLLGLGGVSDGHELIQGPAWPTTWESISNFGTVFITLFKTVMLFKVVEFQPQYGLISGVVLILTHLIIPLQAALFAFTLRKNFRR